MPKIELSKRQLRTLFYWAHVGQASNVCRDYRGRFPNRKTPYDKIESIEGCLNDQKCFLN